MPGVAIGPGIRILLKQLLYCLDQLSSQAPLKFSLGSSQSSLSILIFGSLLSHGKTLCSFLWTVLCPSLKWPSLYRTFNSRKPSQYECFSPFWLPFNFVKNGQVFPIKNICFVFWILRLTMLDIWYLILFIFPWLTWLWQNLWVEHCLSQKQSFRLGAIQLVQSVKCLSWKHEFNYQ